MVHHEVKAELQAAPFGVKARQKPRQGHHHTSAMMSFRRTVVPEHERIRWITHMQTQETINNLKQFN
jgi:hypothetical protein